MEPRSGTSCGVFYAFGQTRNESITQTSRTARNSLCAGCAPSCLRPPLFLRQPLLLLLSGETCLFQKVRELGSHSMQPFPTGFLVTRVSRSPRSSHGLVVQLSLQRRILLHWMTPVYLSMTYLVPFQLPPFLKKYAISLTSALNRKPVLSDVKTKALKNRSSNMLGYQDIPFSQWLADACF